jgi:hypothetical protein
LERQVLDWTGGISSAGISFEAKIMEQQKDNPRFSFLRSTDPYHKYYRWKVSSIKVSSSGMRDRRAVMERIRILLCALSLL